MVKRLVVILLILSAILSLTTCDLLVAIFSMSPFPGYLAQAVASIDMRDDIEKFLGDDYVDWDSDVYTLRNSFREQVFLVVRRNPGPQKIYVFNTSLDLETEHAWNTYRRIALVEADPAENFVVGGGQFDGSTLSILNPDPENSYPPITDDTWNKYTFAHNFSNYIAWNEFDQLGCTEYSTTWMSPNSNSTTIEMGEERRLVGLGYEKDIPDPVLGTAFTVYVFVYGWDPSDNNGDDFLYIIRTNADTYPGPIVTDPDSLIPGLLPYAHASQRVDNVRDNHPIFYTRKGVVAETRTRGTFRLLDLEGEVIKRFYITSDERTPFDFDINGEYYYIFDRQNFRLYKAATGF
jgi:hypothetical protein